MEPLDRRRFLTLVGSAASGFVLPLPVLAQPAEPSYDHAYAILYDATRCIGCRACMRRCREAHGLKSNPARIEGMTFDMPRDLSENDFTIIQAFAQPVDPDAGKPRWTFMRKNCMHCNVPACAAACPVGALRKTDRGPVTYDESRCIGCRYCLLACPYQVPRYEWLNRVPRVRKCELDGACVRACPVEALVDGPRQELIAEAHRRIERNPGRYIDHVYGEHEAGGSSNLILSPVPLERLGFPKLSRDSMMSYAEPIISAVPGWVVGLALFLGALRQLGKGPAGPGDSGWPSSGEGAS